MRVRSLVQLISFAVIVTVGAIWLKSRATAVDLQARLSSLTAVRRNTARALEQNRNRLRSALAEAEQREQALAAAPPSARTPVPPRIVAPSLAMGEWRSSREWRDEGQSTAQKTVGTLLWAAAGGDLAAMMPLIVYDDAARKQAQTLFDSLPPDARQNFPTPEALVASLTLQAVPNNGVQLSWFHQRDANHATVGLILGAPEEIVGTNVNVVPAQGGNPPRLVGPNFTQFTALSLQRFPQGWRIAIPAAAIERLGRQLRPAPGLR
jgi:hypothetical protein